MYKIHPLTTLALFLPNIEKERYSQIIVAEINVWNYEKSIGENIWVFFLNDGKKARNIQDTCPTFIALLLSNSWTQGFIADMRNAMVRRHGQKSL